MTKTLDTPVVFGGAVKALGDGKVGGYLVAFTSGERTDLHGQYFTADTEFMLDAYPVEGRNVLYHHGFDKTIGVRPVGTVVKARKDDVGLWIEAQLNMRDEYERAIYDLVQQEKLGWSSGALPQSVAVDEKGWIKQWCIIEASTTPTPAEPLLTGIQPLKALVPDSEPKEPTAKEAGELDSDTGDVDADASSIVTGKDLSIEIETPDVEEEPTMTPEQIREMMLAVLEELGLMPQTAAQEMAAGEQAMSTALADANYDDSKATDEQRQAMMKTLIAVGAKAAYKAQAARQAAVKSTVAEALADVRRAPVVESVKARAGASDMGAPAVIDNLRVKSKYRNLSPETISFIVDMHMKARHTPDYRAKLGGSPDAEAAIVGVLADHAKEQYTKGKLFLTPDAAADVLSTKANELVHTGQSGFGQQWVPTLWRDQIWERARLENVVLSQFDTFDMSASTEEIPVEWTDPTVSFVAESTDNTHVNPATPVAPFAKIGTQKATFSSKKLMIYTGWSAEEEEDSIIRYSEQAQRQATRAMRDGIDNLLLNGDDVTTANTNINLIDGTPTAGSLFLALDGLLEYALNTSGQSIDMQGVNPLLATIRAARFKLDRQASNDLNGIRLFTHPEVLPKLLDISEMLTEDKAGSAATALTGQLGIIDGMPVLVTAQMTSANTAGKISATGSNNTRGRLLIAYTPYWKVGFRRQVETYLARSQDGQVWTLSVSTRVAFNKRPSTAVASAIYNINIV